uniref:E3 ubiquitin-protein ligase n=1 Tax=Dermatophagoides pteronyssinus TaxID=6956 RepID=A0A6P6YF10_DERPT|nr:E3 ubiquitin-protein ligase rnf146-like [Dermatophagoides pteronyssinus]
MSDLEPCPVCRNKPSHPIKLPCNHIFCFLCAKGSILHNQKCPLCRQHISLSFLNNPQLVQTESISENTHLDNDYHWFYEGHNGWWLYDEQTSKEIENAFQQKELFIEVLIAGYIYIIDLEQMVQYRKGMPNKLRKIQRAKTDTNVKGIAGLRTHPHSRSNLVQ